MGTVDVLKDVEIINLKDRIFEQDGEILTLKQQVHKLLATKKQQGEDIDELHEELIMEQGG